MIKLSSIAQMGKSDRAKSGGCICCHCHGYTPIPPKPCRVNEA